MMNPRAELLPNYWDSSVAMCSLIKINSLLDSLLENKWGVVGRRDVMM